MTGEVMRVLAGSQAHLIKGFVFGLALGFWSGCATRPQEVDRQYMSTFQDTETYLLAKLDQHFESPDVHCELGRFYHHQGNWDKAQYHFSTAMGFNPAHRKTQAAMIKMYIDKGDTDHADQTVERYQRQLWNTPLEMMSLAQALSDEGLDAHSLSCFNKALQMSPHSFEINKQLGLYYLNRDDKEQARSYLTRSFDINPNQPEVAGALGRLGVIVEVPTRYQVQDGKVPQVDESGT